MVLVSVGCGSRGNITGEGGVRVRKDRAIADISIVADGEKRYPLLSAAVENNTGGEASSYDLPVNKYWTKSSEAVIPEKILDLLRKHRGEEAWSPMGICSENRT